MATKKTDSKVMDVSKPTKSKDDSAASEEKLAAPSSKRKVIQPLSENIKPEEPKKTSIKVVSHDDDDGKDNNDAPELPVAAAAEASSDDSDKASDIAVNLDEKPAECDFSDPPAPCKK